MILNACFAAILLLAVLAIVPWSAIGGPVLRRLAVSIPVPVWVLVYVYETAMPARFDIRVDLVLLLPAYSVVLLATLARLLTRRRARDE